MDLQLVAIKGCVADVFSVPSASLALRISPANDKVACWMLFPPVSYTRITYSSELSAF